ncbi:MAG: hypothetical protein LBQ87_04425, partial [Candidatus Fibromonas sp.]|nr:hypothetical protein [Candidatus Fibromonas sp.]
MKSLRIIARATLLLALCSLTALAQEADSSLIAGQRAVLGSLDSIEKNSLGFALNGRAKAGILSSSMDSKALPEEESHSEYQSFTDFLLSISIRPGSETRALFDLRFHKDWQSSFREGNNTPIVSWWSYDGLILDKIMSFNVGTMRVAYTPLTIATPGPDFIFEPQVFAEKRAEAMADRYLDDSGKRLLQGLNVEINLPLGFFDNVFFQSTIARLRNNAKKADQVFFDFDPYHDRYATAARLELEAFGFKAGVSDVYSFDRVRSTHVKFPGNIKDSLDYEYNNVLSFNGGASSKKWISGPVDFGVNVEVAISNWMHYQEYKSTKQDTIVMLGTPSTPLPCFNCPDTLMNGFRYPYYSVYPKAETVEFDHVKVGEWHDQAALLANVYVNYSDNSIKAKLSGNYLKTDVGFESELAANPSYLPTMPILNSNAAFESQEFGSDILGHFRSGSLENLYYSLYYTLPLNAGNMMSGSGGNPGNLGTTGQLFNNYKFAHYYRNAYTYRAHTRLERYAVAGNLDPSVNMALPYGYATPDRQGGDADLRVNWNDAVLFRGVFGKYASDFEGEYTRLGAGLAVKIDRLASLSRPLDVSVSYEQNKEEKYMEREASRIMAGFSAGIWSGISLLGGVQILDKKFGLPYGGVVGETS